MSCGTIFACNFLYLMVFFNYHSFVTFNSKVIVSNALKLLKWSMPVYCGKFWSNVGEPLKSKSQYLTPGKIPTRCLWNMSTAC